MRFHRWLSRGAGLGLALLVAEIRAAEAPRPWPEAAPAVLREEVFGVRFRQMREIDGNKPALRYLRQRFEQHPTPAAKAYMAWVMIFSEGWGSPEMKDVEQGLALAQEAAVEGSIVARDVLARARGLDLGGKADPAEVIAALRTAADAGATRSLARLAFFHAIGYGVIANPTEADRLAARAAQLGQPAGLIEIGQAYESGQIGGTPNLDRAIGYYDQACGYGAPEAWQRLEELEKKGVPTARYYRALGYLREANRAAWIAPSRVREKIRVLEQENNGDPRVQLELGTAHLDGVYAARDHARAREYLTRAAVEGGSREARFLLAKMQLRGWGERAAPAAAISTIQELADAGEMRAATYLGWVHYWGVKEAPGLVKDPAKAFAYCRRAAEAGEPVASLNLAFCYEEGIGTAVDYAIAAKLYWQAYLRGYVRGRDRVRRLMAFIKDD